MAKDVEKGVRDLALHFGRLVANHRRRTGWSQEVLAERAEISEGMVAKIETGATGVRFPMIVRIAQALDVDPVELFYSQMPKGKLHQGKLRELVVRLEEISDSDLDWIGELLSVAMRATGRRTFEMPEQVKRRRIVARSSPVPRRKGRKVSYT